MNTSHTPGPWKHVAGFDDYEGIHGINGLPVAEMISSSRSRRTADARLIAAAPELLDELEKANQIIQNALNIITTEQKIAWGKKNVMDGVDGEGITRANERAVAIAKATRGAA